MCIRDRGKANRPKAHHDMRRYKKIRICIGCFLSLIHIFHDSADAIFYLAGFCRHSEENGEPVDRYTLLRSRPNKYLMLYHIRMPLLLKKEEVRDWLNGTNISYYLNRQPFRLKAEPVGTSRRIRIPKT